MTEHKAQPSSGPGGRMVCRECGKGVSRRKLDHGRRVVWVHHNPTGLRRYNAQVAVWGR